MKLITTHINADFDAFASMVAVKKLHPGALPVFPGSCELKVKEFIQLYPEFAVHRLKEIKSDEVKELIVVDTAMPGRIGDLARFIGWKNIKVTVYDHHPVVGGEIKAEVMVKGVNGSPTGATISILVKELKEKNIPISPREATLFAIALYEETGFFSYLSTTQLEFDMMSHLLGCGANLNIIKDFLKEGFSPEQDILFGRLLASMESHEIKGIPVKIAFAETEQYVKDIALLVHKLREMGNLVVVFAVVKFSDRINIIARSSIEEVNVGEVVREFGGGGHGSAASATLREGGLVEVKERLLAVLERKIKPFLRAKDIMSSPVLSIKPDISCDEGGLWSGMGCWSVARLRAGRALRTLAAFCAVSSLTTLTTLTTSWASFSASIPALISSGLLTLCTLLSRRSGGVGGGVGGSRGCAVGKLVPGRTRTTLLACAAWGRVLAAGFTQAFRTSSPGVGFVASLPAFTTV